MQRINTLKMTSNGGVWKNDYKVSWKESHGNNTLPRVIVGFGPSVTYSCRCKSMDVYHTLNIRTCWIYRGMGTEACMVNFQISTSLINHFSYYIDFHLEKSERHNWYTSIKVSSVPQAKLGGWGWSGGWVANFFVKSQKANILDFVDLCCNYSTLPL